MKRDFEQTLLTWKDSPHKKPLIVKGARQVGKTYVVKEFGKRYFSDGIVIVDLERNIEWHKVFQKNLDAAQIISELEILTNKRIHPGTTLLFFDEIQSCPSALSALRYFHEEMPELHVIAAGSLLEFVLKDISFPVGRVQFSTLLPMTFCEYLLAIGRDALAEVVSSAPKKLSESVHMLLLDELKHYFFIGGMPESVARYSETKSVHESLELQSDLIQAYRQDFSKYSPQVDKRCLDQVLLGITRNISHQIKYSLLSEDFTHPTVKKSLQLLSLAQVVRLVTATNPSGLPLGAGVHVKVYKAILLDVGLLQSLRGVPSGSDYTKANLLDIHRGALAEQFVGQEILPSQGTELYYWSRAAKSSSAEVDYLVILQGHVVPIEVKSGSVRRIKSVQLFLETYPDSPGGIVFSADPYHVIPEKKLKVFPLYYAGYALKPERSFEEL